MKCIISVWKYIKISLTLFSSCLLWCESLNSGRGKCDFILNFAQVRRLHSNGSASRCVLTMKVASTDKDLGIITYKSIGHSEREREREMYNYVY